MITQGGATAAAVHMLFPAGTEQFDRNL